MQLLVFYRALKNISKDEKICRSEITPCDKKKELGHYKPYHMEVHLWPKIRTKFFQQKVGANILPPIQLHNLRITVVHDIMPWRCKKTSETLPMTKKASTEYHGSGRNSPEKTKRFLFTVSIKT